MSYPYQGGYSGGPGYPPAGGMPQPAQAPAGLPYPAQPYAGQAGYPQNAPYPAQGAVPMPGAMPGQGTMPMPSQGGMAMPGEAPYPPGPGSSPYPPGPPGGPGSAPYPPSGQGGTPYPPGGQGSVPYPPGGQASSSYPPSGPGSAPYPPSGQGASPYPPSGQNNSSYPQGPPGGSSSSSYPAPSGDAGAYPSNPSASGGSPYPSTTPSTAPSESAPTRPSHSPSKKAQSSQGSDTNSTHYYTVAKKSGDSGTVPPLISGFNPEADATQIRNCLKSSFINETVIVNILPHRSNAQRQQIRLMYKTMSGKDLLQDMRDRLSGDFESVTAGLLMAPDEYDAYQINKAIQGAGTDEDALVQILCTRTNAQMKELCRRYKEIYKGSIEQHMKGDTSGHFMRMLISLANGARQEDQDVNQQKAEDDAKKLYKAGAGRLGTDESTFNSILVSQSFEQLRAVFTAYKRLYNKDMEKVIKSEMSGDLESGMKTIVRFTLDKHAYFANVLYKAMKGLGTDEKTLIRTLVSRSEIDLENIKTAFNAIKGESKSLAHWIKKETSGPFRDMLLHLIGGAS